MTAISQLKKYYILIGIAVFFLCIETLADLMQPMLLSKVVDEGLTSNQLSLVFQYGSFMLLATACGLIGALMRNWISTHVSYAYARDLRESLFRKLLQLRITEVEELEGGSLVTRLTVDVNMIQQFINGLMRIFLKAPLLAIGSFFMVRQLDSRFMKVYLVLIPIVLVITAIQLKIGYPLYARIQKIMDRINQQTMEFLGGIRTVRAFNRFRSEKETFDTISHDLAHATTQTMRYMSIFGPLIMLNINLGIVFVIYFGKSWYLTEGVGVGQLIAFSNYMTQFYFAMSIISRVFTIFVRAKASIQRIDAVYAQKGFKEQVITATSLTKVTSDTPSTTSDVAVSDVNNDITSSSDLAIELEHVYFRYGDGMDTLKDITFSIKKSMRVGIIGATGSGKSTLVQVLQRILEMNSGSIKLFGQDLQTLSKAQISQMIGYVPQKVTLFTGSVLENLSWGKRDLSDAAYYQALRMAEAYTFVDQMPHKLNSQIGRNGIQLSGGQKQRLSIARAIISNPKLLILDDVTSAVDVLTEQSIKSNLAQSFHSDLTTLIIAQKISTVIDLDYILVLDRGELVATGTHETLLTSSSYYRELYAAETGSSSVQRETIEFVNDPLTGIGGHDESK